MSGQCYPSTTSSEEETLSYNQAYHPTSLPYEPHMPTTVPGYTYDSMAQEWICHAQSQWYHQPGGYQSTLSYQCDYNTPQT